MTEQPSRIYDGKKFFVIGCRYCDTTNQTWIAYTDGNDFIIECPDCGHVTETKKGNITTHPEYSKPIDRRFF